MRPQKDQDKKEVEEILKKVQSQSPQEKKNITHDLLQGKKPASKGVSFSYTKLISNSFKEKWRYYIRRGASQQSKNLMMITIFLLFSSYMCWKIEEKYDTMRSKATVTKSFKQQKIDEENERIEKYLKRNEFRSIPIKTEEEDDEQYQYKQEGEFDTKEYLLQAIAREHQAGKKIDENYEKQLRQKGII